ncbi:MAG: TrfB-related DNA-binding protein [Pseudomonadota bacterium]|mgnify:CR=1 FL=1
MTAQTKDPVKYSAAEWEQLQPALRSLSVSTISTARQVLVEGRSAPDVAKELDCARQTVHAAVKRVRARLEKYEAAELVPVLVWVPQEAVEAVKDHAREQGGVVEGDKPKAKRKKATKAAAKAK